MAGLVPAIHVVKPSMLCKTISHLIATLHFDDLGAIQRGLGSPEGQAAVADLAKFATSGADIFMFDSREA